MGKYLILFLLILGQSLGQIQLLTGSNKIKDEWPFINNNFNFLNRKHLFGSGSPMANSLSCGLSQAGTLYSDTGTAFPGYTLWVCGRSSDYVYGWERVMASGGGGSSYIFSSPLVNSSGTVSLNQSLLGITWSQILSGHPTASGSTTGLLTSTDWSTFNNKQASLGFTPEQVLTFSSPLVRTTNTISVPVATSSVNGYLASSDWVIFNAKQSAITGAPASWPSTFAPSAHTHPITDLQAIPANTILGNNTGSSDVPVALTLAQIKTFLALSATDVGLGNVDNTSDATKNADTATLTNKTLTLPIIGSYTVAGLPAAGTAGRVAVVTDAATAGNCTVGGGSTLAHCRDSGSAWVALGDGGSGGGSSPAGSGSELQYRDGSTFGALAGSSVASGALTLGTNGAASAPAFKLVGTPYTGGTATTTKPLFLIEPSGTTSTAWNTSGTVAGINAPSGYNGMLLDAQINGVTKFRVDMSTLTMSPGSGVATLSSLTSGAGGWNVYFPQGVVSGFGISTGQNLNRADGNHVGVFSISQNIGPDSGTSPFSAILNIPVINQTGTATGPIRSFFSGPTITRAYDFRHLETKDTTINVQSGSPDQQSVLFGIPTYASAAAKTLTNAATVKINGGPVAGTNVTITNSYALRVVGGISSFDGGIKLLSSTVAGLPTCNTANQDLMLTVTDATAPIYNGALTGGGSVRVPVFCDGTSWTSH